MVTNGKRGTHLAIALFAGAGGLSEGFRRAGFKILVANELKVDACKTYSHNHPETTLLCKDIRKVETKELLNLASDCAGTTLKAGEIEVIFGGPPCQGFSTAGEKKLEDPRNNLPFEFLRIVTTLKPKMFVIENVPGLVRMTKYQPLLNLLEGEIRTLGYKSTWDILEVARYGVPQLRERFVLVASRTGNVPLLPEPSHSPPPQRTLNQLPKTPTIGEVLADLPRLNPGESSDDYDREALTEIAKKLRNESTRLHNHVASRHSKRRIAMFKSIPQGGTWDDAEPSLRGNKRMFKRYHPDHLAWTVTSAPEDAIHYEDNRIPTVREMARLQTFPDTYEFLGQRTAGNHKRKEYSSQTQQVGNAVPVFFAEAIASCVRGQLGKGF